MPQGEIPQEATPFPSLWKLTVKTLKTWKDGWSIFTIINLITVVAGGLAWILVASVMPWLSILLTSGKGVDPDIIAAHYPTTASLIADLASVGAILLAFIFCIVMSQIMTLEAMKAESRHKGLRHLFSLSLARAPYYLWTTTIVSMMLVGGFALLLVPGILLLPLAMATIFIAALENKSGFEAVRQGTLYTRGYILATLWRSVIIVFVIHGISLLLPLLATLLVYPFTLLNFAPHTIHILSFIAGTLYTFVSFLLSLVTPSLLMIFYYNLYLHIKDNPHTGKPTPYRLLQALAWFGFLIIIGAILLESFGF